MATRDPDASPEGAAPPGTQAIGRALATLKLLAECEQDLTVARIAAELGLSSGTANRVIRALAAGGLVTHNALTDGYYLGTGAVLLGQAAQRGFGLDRALPVLEQVNAETEESVNLAVREGTESVVMLRVQSTLPLRFEQHTGARFPLYTTASGKAILAHSVDTEQYLAALPERLPRLTEHTLDTPAKLAEQLEQVRRRGYSVDAEENVAGVRCVGAPVLDSDGRAHAALVIQVPTVRMPGARLHELGARAMTAAKEIAQFVPINRNLSR
ncbi:IclR family transcriptional regulator [Amycolatopsis nigrescens]|uniref:IclR family transcriptional regulator n=1 Tax=Amycolatopsis nigrescens TaxID=381445 RepID=UPI00037CBD6D|nr:IclR family transcriptional regulator [Amycolatopsis nigrescens]